MRRMTRPEALGREIRAEAAAQSIALTELATKAGVARSALYRYLDAERDLPIGTLFAIADVLRTPASTLTQRAENRARRPASTRLRQGSGV